MRRLVVTSLTLVLLAACTDTNLYHPNIAPVLADRLALTGQVCTADPATARYPVRVVIVADRAAGPLFDAYDPGGKRIATLSAFVQSALSVPVVEMAVVGYGGAVAKLAPLEGTFTRNPGELLAAMTQLQVPQPCIGESACRDTLDAVRSAKTVIEGDLAALPAGTRVLTQYVVLLLNSGPQSPLAVAGDCCVDGETCPGAGDPSPECQIQLAAEAVAGLRQAVNDGGAAGLRLHAIHLAADEEEETKAQVAETMKAMAFAGGGRFKGLVHLDGGGVGVRGGLGIRTEMRVKYFIVSNINARPTPDGTLADSDADGLTDVQEADIGTSPTSSDTDADGISDLVEVLVALDPFVFDEPTACIGLFAEQDTDYDGLSDCDEVLLGTDPSLVDSDGDALPDRLELSLLTDYVVSDAHLDSDGDGASNGDEVQIHTDPRSTDLAAHFNVGYRYEIVDDGLQVSVVLPELEYVTGVEFKGVGGGTTGGLGTLRWSSADRTLSWQDAGDGEPGPPIAVGSGGQMDLPSASWAPLQGDDGRVVTVVVSAADLPPVDIAEQAKVLFRNRHCLSYTVRNIRLLETLSEDGDPGVNNIFVYFAQAPEDRPDIPGPYRLAEVPVRFIPPDFRDPGSAVLEVLDVEFVDPLPGE